MRPWRDSKYLRWIRTLPCVVCGTTKYIEAAHTGPHGLGQKSPDSSAIPLCSTHHRTGKDCYHKLGPRRFADLHNLDIQEVVNQLNTKPMIRIISGNFIAIIGKESRVLGTVDAGLVQAVRAVISLKHEMVVECRQVDSPGLAAINRAGNAY